MTALPPQTESFIAEGQSPSQRIAERIAERIASSRKTSREAFWLCAGAGAEPRAEPASAPLPTVPTAPCAKLTHTACRTARAAHARTLGDIPALPTADPLWAASEALRIVTREAIARIDAAHTAAEIAGEVYVKIVDRHAGINAYGAFLFREAMAAYGKRVMVIYGLSPHDSVEIYRVDREEDYTDCGDIVVSRGQSPSTRPFPTKTLPKATPPKAAKRWRYALSEAALHSIARERREVYLALEILMRRKDGDKHGAHWREWDAVMRRSNALFDRLTAAMVEDEG